MAFTKSVLVGVAVALAATAAGGQSALPFASASSLSVEPSTGQVAFIRDGQLLLWDGQRERLVLPKVDPFAVVGGFAGEHIRLELGDEGGPFEARVVHVEGKELLRLTSEDVNAGLGAVATLSLDGTAVWEQRVVYPGLRRESKIRADVPDFTPVLVSRDLTSGVRRVRIFETGPGSAAPFRLASLVMIGVDDALMTVWGGAVVRTSKGAISWQLPGQASGPPWRVLDVHLRSGLAALRDGQRNLRLLRLADGTEQRAWRFAEDPASLERFLAASLGAQAWQKELAKARERYLQEISQPGSPVVASEPVWDARCVYFLASGALVASFGMSLVPVILLPDRQEPVAELVTVKSALGLPSLTCDRGKGLQQFRRGDGWSAMMFDGNQYREVPPELLPLPH
jgi:hypothetical protein